MRFGWPSSGRWTKLCSSRQNFAFKRDAATRNSLDTSWVQVPAMEKFKTDDSHGRFNAKHNPGLRESGTGKELVARAVHSVFSAATEPLFPSTAEQFPETVA
jgi:hypothetical protein